MSTEQRIEHDAWGNIPVPGDHLWGAKTQRSIEHFAISTERMPPELLHALALVKSAAARVNQPTGRLAADKASICSRQRCSRGSLSRGRRLARSTAPTVCSRLRSASARMPYLRWITSPCSVTRSTPATAPRGEDISAGVMRAPPRLAEPPRPWKNARWMPAACATSSSSTWARCRPQREASVPPSLPLSE